MDVDDAPDQGEDPRVLELAREQCLEDGMVEYGTDLGHEGVMEYSLAETGGVDDPGLGAADAMPRQKAVELRGGLVAAEDGDGEETQLHGFGCGVSSPVVRARGYPWPSLRATRAQRKPRPPSRKPGPPLLRYAQRQ